MGPKKKATNNQETNCEVVGSYNQVEQLSQKIEQLQEIIDNQQDELLGLYRRLACFDR